MNTRLVSETFVVLSLVLLPYFSRPCAAREPDGSAANIGIGVNRRTADSLLFSSFKCRSVCQCRYTARHATVVVHRSVPT